MRRLGIVAAILVLLAVALAAGAFYLSTVFYIGVDDGALTIYSGVPGKVGPLPLHVRLPPQRRELRLALAGRAHGRRRRAAPRPRGRHEPVQAARDVAVSRRNLELVFLILAGAVSTMAYVSVYAGRFREINSVSIVYGLVFVGIFLLLHVLERVFLPQADPFLLPITALLAAIGLTEIFRIRPHLALRPGTVAAGRGRAVRRSPCSSCATT